VSDPAPLRNERSLHAPLRSAHPPFGVSFCGSELPRERRFLDEVRKSSLPRIPLNTSYESCRSNSLPVEIIAPLSTAGTPPPGCTDAPTRHSQGRLLSE
jgi:hypothetical protein